MNRTTKAAILASCAALLVVHAAVTMSAGAAVTAAAAGKPKAVVAEPIKEMGTIAKGEKAIHTFQIKNEGDAPLDITDVKASCGCTVAAFDKSILPGQTGNVRVEVDTSTFNGAIAKGVTAYTNDVDLPQIELTVRVKVEPYVLVKPGYARFIIVQGEEKEGSIAQTLWATDGAPMDVVQVDSPYPFLKVAFREAKPEERVADVTGKQWRVEMTLASDAAVGALTEYVTVHTNHHRQKLVQIPVSGFVRPVIAITPPKADFGTLDLKEPFRRSFSVRNFATDPIHLSEPTPTVSGLQAKLEPIQDGREYQLQITLNPPMAKGPFAGKVTMKTDNAKLPVLELEVKGTVR